MAADLHSSGAWAPPSIEGRSTPPRILDAQGNLLPIEDLVQSVGETAALSLMLDYFGSKRYGAPATRGYPPRLFISYRRESAEHIAWVVELGQRVRAQGYEVLLDELSVIEPNDNTEIALHMARLYYADAIVIVVSEHYFAQPDEYGNRSMSTFVYEELQRVCHLSALGMVEVIVIVLAGTDSDLVEFGINPGRHAVFDFRGAELNTEAITRALGTYAGPVFSDAEQDEIAHIAHDAIAVSLEGLGIQWDMDVPSPPVPKTRGTDPCAVLRTSAGFLVAHEYKVASVACEWASGNRAAAIELALEALSSNPPIALAADLAEWLWLMDADFAAFQELAQLADGPGRWLGMVHHMMGDILFRYGSYEDALNHFNFCVAWFERKDLRNPFGPQAELAAAMNAARVARCWSLMGRTDRAELFLDRAIRWSHGHPNIMELVSLIIGDKQHFVRQYAYWECGHCGAMFPLAASVCGLCGCRSRVDSCEMCGLIAPPQTPDNMGFCPVCRKTTDSNQKGASRVQFVDRRLGGRWSFAAPPNEPWAGEPGGVFRGYNLARPDPAETGLGFQRANPWRTVGQPFQA